MRPSTILQHGLLSLLAGRALAESALNATIAASSAAALGINCRGSGYCDYFTDYTSRELWKVIENRIDPNRWYNDGQQVACAGYEQLTAAGLRSPMNPAAVLPNTVRCIRLKHQVLRDRHQSHPRQIPGCLTVTQLARALDCSVHWLYDRIHNGTIAIAPDPATGAYLFPDHPHTLHQFAQLRAGTLATLRFDPAPLLREPQP